MIFCSLRRRHISLLRSLVADAGASVVPVHTIIEVYRVAAGMPLVRVLPSAQDEVNAAAFHPFKVGRASLPRRALKLLPRRSLSPHLDLQLCPGALHG